MNKYHQLSLKELEDFQDSRYKDSLISMINYVIQRKY